MENGEHYNDPTPAQAIANMKHAEKRKHLMKAVAKAKQVLRREGYEVAGRITLVDIKTGKIIF